MTRPWWEDYYGHLNARGWAVGWAIVLVIIGIGFLIQWAVS